MRLLLIALVLFTPIQVVAASFTIKAKYSNQFGLPILDDTDSMITSLGAGLDISSRDQCLSELQGDMVERIATGYGMEYGATNVVLKCTKYWRNENCPSIYPGCISSADFGRPRHIQTYDDGAIIAPHLRFSLQEHEVIQTISYGEDSDQDGNLDIGFVVQKKLDLKNNKTASDSECRNMIESQGFKKIIKEQYFEDRRTKAYKINCFYVNNSGKATGVASEIIRR
ncbi:hypothetical protein LCGC14_1953640 [marine sediment metagenome]|uniref:Uncharacterized protein n=1 Tax=marine sediment metagenome TaxID=412755 RepID=A0A0F9HV20_9ZZZZ|nr:hypothetical protein [Actinomycetota bacterium]